MTQTTNNTTIFVTEYPSFDTAWKAATETSALFAAFQGMENKIKYIKQAQRWFVTENNELYYSYLTDDGVRNTGNEIDGLQDRQWAYVKDGKLPVFFEDSAGNETAIKVPARFHAELAATNIF
jgi:hypothetical protein